MKRLLSGGMPRIFQLVHASRAEESGRLHEAEFMMLEWYRAFHDASAVMQDTEQVVASVARALRGSESLFAPDGRTLDARPPFARISVRQAFREHAGVEDAVQLASDDEDRYFELLVSQVEPGLAALTTPVFLCEYPLRHASLARPSPRDPSVAERFELYAGGVELCNGFGELTDPAEQRRRFERDRAERGARGQPLYPIDEKLLAALEAGLPPCAGNALGFDRLIMLATGAAGVADVQAFPRQRV
jgi:lysyl-tRNA synthetase class 2